MRCINKKLLASLLVLSLSLGTVQAAYNPKSLTDADIPNNITVNLAVTATALAANGANCSAGEYPLGVNASGAVESCTNDDDRPDEDSEVPDDITINTSSQLIVTKDPDTGLSLGASVVINPATATFNDRLLGIALNGADRFWVDAEGDVFALGQISANLDGNAATATAFQTNPSDCSAETYATAIAANGDLTCAAVPSTIVTAFVQKTSTYTITNSDATIECTSGTFDLTLPTAVGITGQVFNLKNSGAGVITIKTTSAQTIDGFVSGTLTLIQYANLTVQSNGSNWIIL